MPASTVLFELPYSPAHVSGESWLAGQGTMELCIPLERDGAAEEAVLEFSPVRAYRYTVEALCVEFQISAYDKLVEVGASPWLTELIDGREALAEAEGRLTHFMIYIADEGCYEFAARTWRYFERRAIA